MSSIPNRGRRLPSWLRCVALVPLALAAIACVQDFPTEVEPEPVADHLPWGGCTEWNGLSFATVYFEPGSATLDDGDRADLDANIVLLNKCREEGFHVVGEAVKEKKSRQVAAARAQVVADYYRQHDLVNPDRMEVSTRVIPGCGKRWGPCWIYRAVETF